MQKINEQTKPGAICEIFKLIQQSLLLTSGDRNARIQAYCFKLGFSEESAGVWHTNPMKSPLYFSLLFLLIYFSLTWERAVHFVSVCYSMLFRISI